MKNTFIIFLLLLLSKNQLFSQIIADFETPATTPKFGYGKDAKLIDNPDKIGNPSSKVAYYKKEATNWKFIALDFPSKIAIKSNDVLSFKVRSSTKGRVYPKFWLGSTLITEAWANDYNFQPEANKWTACSYDLSKVLNKEFDRIEIAVSVDNEAEADAYLDDFKLYNSSSPNGEPFASLKSSALKAQVNQTISFDGSGSYDVNGGAISIAWDFQDGTKATGTKVSKSFANEGVYKVSMTVTNNQGITTKKIATIVIFQLNQQISKLNWENNNFLSNQKIEGSFALFNDYKNVYDPDEISIDAEISLPDSKKMIVPCYYFIKGFYENNQWKVDSTTQFWAVRFSSPQVGTHKVVLKLTDKNGISSSSSYTLEVKQATQKGVIGMDANNIQHYRHQTGEPFYPLGINVAWNTTSNYTTIINNLSDANANLVRYWQVPFNRQALEWKKDGYTGGIGVYSQQAAAMQDSMINLAMAKNIRLQLVLFQHGMFSENVNSNWADNPYNVALGGPLNKAEEFFYNESVKRNTKKLLRYIIARWGYSPNVFAWELFNEVQYTGVNNAQTATWKSGVLTWHDEMGKYIKSIDAFKHIVTTSADDNQCISMDRLLGLDVVQYHLYNTKLLLTQNAQDKKFKDVLIRTGVINGEYGEDVNTAKVPFEKQRISIWTGIMSQVPHLMWLWDDYTNPDWANLFKHPAAFVKGKDFVKEEKLQNWNPTSSASGISLTTVGMKSIKNYYAVIYDENLQDNLSGGILNLSDLPTGKYKITYTNIITGAISTIDSYTLIGDAETLKLPTFSKGIVVAISFVEAFIPTAVESEIEGDNLNVFPNPTKGDVSIEFKADNSSKAELTLTDITGKIVTSQINSIIPNQKNTVIFPLKNANLSSGAYFIKLNTKSQSSNIRLFFLNN
jgi:PKD repeat protein